MTKKSNYIDIAFLTAIGILFVFVIKLHFFDDFIIPVNTYVGFLFWIIVVAFKIKAPAKSGFLVTWLLIFATLNIIGFSVQGSYIGRGGSFEYKGLYFWPPGINPAILPFFILYVLLNWTVSKALLKKIFKPGEAEVEGNYQKQFLFYYNKFVMCSDAEFNEIVKMFKEYPVEAQKAILQIRAERKI